jgi:small subunit ribosomal protein S2
MKEFIFGERNGIYIIDLQKTLKQFKEAAKFVTELAANGKAMLFVGTKRQAQETIAEEAQRCGMYYVNHRWLGGLLTNFATIQKSIQRFKELDEMVEDGRMELRPKKEQIRLLRERKHLEQNLTGIKALPGLPDALFVIDSSKEQIAVREARRVGVPVVAVVDTNCDPDEVDYVVPGNDDALRAIRLFTGKIADCVLEGRSVYEQAQFEAQKAEAGVVEEMAEVPSGEEGAAVPEGAEYAEVSSEYVPEEPEAPASTVEAYEQATDEDTFASGDDEGTPRRPK